MSGFTGKRQAIASALATVPDVHGHAYRPAPPTEGDGWPVLGPFDRAAGDAFLATWRVRVMLPQDEEQASVWIDAHWSDLYYALKPHGHIQRGAPVMLASGGSEMYCLEITMIAEE